MRRYLIIIFMLLLPLVGCSKDFSYLEEYEPITHIRSEDAVDLDPFYEEVLFDYYEVDNIKSHELYRDSDTVYLKYNLVPSATYDSVAKALTFSFEKLANGRISRVFTGTIGGNSKEVYPEDYEYWDSVQVEFYIDDIQLGTVYYNLDIDNFYSNSIKTFNSDDSFDTMHLTESMMAMHPIFESLDKSVGDLKYYKSITGYVLFIDVPNVFMKSTNDVAEIKTKLLREFNTMSESELYYFICNYPVIGINFKDHNGRYHSSTFVFDKGEYMEIDKQWNEVNPFLIERDMD